VANAAGVARSLHPQVRAVRRGEPVQHSDGGHVQDAGGTGQPAQQQVVAGAAAAVAVSALVHKPVAAVTPAVRGAVTVAVHG